jgi:O-antigen ligase
MGVKMSATKIRHEDEPVRNLIIAGVCILLFFRPLVCGMTFKWSNTYSQLLIFLLGFVWLLWMTCTGKFRIRVSGPDIPILLFLVLMIIATIRSVSLNSSLAFVFQFVSYLILYYLVANNLKSASDINLVLWVMILSCGITAAYGIFQYFVGLPMTRTYVMEQHAELLENLEYRARLMSNRIFSTFVYPPAFAGYLVTMIPVVLAMSVYRVKNGWKLSRTFILIATFLLMLAALFLTYSKGGWLVFLVEMAVYGVVYGMFLRRRRAYERKQMAKMTVYWLSGIVLACVVIVFISTRSYEVQGIAGYLRSFSVRYEYWVAGAKIIKERPFLGFGPGSFTSVYPKFKLPEAQETRLAHNNFIQVAAEMGLPASFAFVAIWLLIIIMWVKWAAADNAQDVQIRSTRILTGGILTGLVAFLIHSLVDFDLYVPGITTNIWAFAGILAAAPGVGTDTVRTIEIPLGTGMKRTAGVLLVIIFVCASAVVTMPLVADHHLNVGLEYAKQGQVYEALQEFGIAERYDRTNPQYNFYAGKVIQQVYISKTQRQEPVPDDIVHNMIWEYKKAIKKDPYFHQYHYELGMAYTALAHESEALKNAISEIEIATSLYPSRPKYHGKLAELYEKAGETEKAAGEKETARHLQNLTGQVAGSREL